ncbi:hypothetical protein [Legionella rubrilucens]|uniref:hypothetical protein n=1 Tax=Legionella rubrilucens TaxID=458 RepID=UPI0007310326|nr:hypothetical protein [Legionella rubrilucens]
MDTLVVSAILALLSCTRRRATIRIPVVLSGIKPKMVAFGQDINEYPGGFCHPRSPVLPELVSAILTSSCLAGAGGQPFESRLFLSRD